MTLPIVNDVPKYELVIPSTKQKIKYRPFLVKEQKILLIAMETRDQGQILNSIIDIIRACILDPIDVKSFTTFDLEYIFTQIRAKSVGEKSTVNLICTTCEHTNEVTIDLESIKVNMPTVSNMVIKLNDTFSLKMRYPNYTAMIANDKLINSESSAESVMELITVCLDSLLTEDTQIKFDDEPREEVTKFLGNLNSDQFKKIIEFVETIPKLEHKVTFNCKQCNAENYTILKGIDDFF